MDWQRAFRRILEIRPALKMIMKDRCFERGNCLVILDNPLEIELHDREVRFLVNGELAGILSENGLDIFEDEARKEIEYWCIALTSPGFRRFAIKRK